MTTTKKAAAQPAKPAASKDAGKDQAQDNKITVEKEAEINAETKEANEERAEILDGDHIPDRSRHTAAKRANAAEMEAKAEQVAIDEADDEDVVEAQREADDKVKAKDDEKFEAAKEHAKAAIN